MAVTMAPLPNRLWQGTSGDSKPADARVVVNDVWYQTDTQTYFVWTGAAWSQCSGVPTLRNA